MSDKSPNAYFKKFHQHLDKTAVYNSTFHSINDQKVYPYRYGSYYVYEANNKTKTFRVAAFVNTTSQDSVAMFP